MIRDDPGIFFNPGQSVVIWPQVRLRPGSGQAQARHSPGISGVFLGLAGGCLGQKGMKNSNKTQHIGQEVVGMTA